MPYSYNNTAYSDATMTIHLLGLCYCIPILIMSILKRNIACKQSIHLKTLSTQRALLALDNTDQPTSVNDVVNIKVMQKQKSLNEKEKRNDIQTNQQLAQYSIVSIILYANCLLFSVISCLPLNPPMSEPLQNIFDVIAQQSWLIAQSLCYLIFTRKLQHVFENTEYEIPLKYYKYLYSSITFFIIDEIILSITILLQSANVINLDSFVIFAVIESILQLIISILLSTSMIYLFVHALLQISIDSDYGHHSFDEPVSSTFDKYQQLLTDLSTKLSVLSFWSLLSTQIFVFMSALVFILWAGVGVDQLWRMAAMLWFYNLLWVVSSIVNVTCLFLNLPGLSKQYNKFCNSCHQCGQGLGEKKVYELNSKVADRYSIMKDYPQAKFSE